MSIFKRLRFIALLTSVLLIYASLLLTPTHSVADEAAATIKAGRQKAQGCTRCHGRNGIRQASLRAGFAGTVGEFATQELMAFRSGARIHAIMTGVAQVLTDQDIREISAWLDATR